MDVVINLSDYFNEEDIANIVGTKNKYPLLSLHSGLSKLIREYKIYPYDILGKWFYNKYKDTEEYSVLKEVDRYSYLELYCELYNPISISSEINKSTNRYILKCILFSIDDIAFGFIIEDIPDYNELDKIRNNVFSYIDSLDRVNCLDFVDYGITSLGGKDYSW